MLCFAPPLSGGFGSGEEVLLQFDGIHHQFNVGGATGDPVASIAFLEEGNAHLDRGGVGGALGEGGGHCPLLLTF